MRVSKKISIKLLLSNVFKPAKKSKAFRAIWIGNSLSSLGSTITLTVFPLLVYSIQHSTLAMGSVMAAYMLPNVIILPFSGVIVDKMNRVKIMRFADAIRMVLTLFATVIGFQGLLTIPMIIVVAAIIGLMNGLFDPAFSALRATIFTPDIRTSATSLLQGTLQLMRLVGPTLGAVLVSSFSAPIAFGVDSISYAISFAFLLTLSKEGQIKHHKEETFRKGCSFFREAFKGFSVLIQNTWLWVTILDLSFLNICRSGITSILLPWVVRFHFGFPSFVYGLIMSGEGIGGILAAAIFGSKTKWSKRGLIAYLGLGSAGFSLLLMALIPNSFVLVVLMALEGAGIMVFGLIWEISLQELVKNEDFGRVAALDQIGSFALMPVGYLLTGYLAQQFGSTLTMAMLGGLITFSTIIILLIPQIRHFN
ncbi:MAG: MFS transporter [Oenococcus sp.]|uniref:MFS transporter n=1 Tax=Oenococcus sp. TaxID=1979414 RepID=UPI0039E7A883